MSRKSEFTYRPCARCGTLVIDVRDAYTFATFPVEAQSVSQEGLVLTPNKDTRKNPFADRAVVFVPHLPLCPPAEPEDSEDGANTDPVGPVPIEPIQGPTLPKEYQDPGSLPPGGMAGEEEQEF